LWKAAKRQRGEVEKHGLIEWSNQLRVTIEEALAIERYKVAGTSLQDCRPQGVTNKLEDGDRDHRRDDAQFGADGATGLRPPACARGEARGVTMHAGSYSKIFFFGI
jgi:hypothetical protein